MKGLVKKIVAGVVCVSISVSLCGCGVVDKLLGNNPDYDQIIGSFVSDSLNTTELEVGQEDKPGSAIWLQQGFIKGKVYCDNESVVQVTDLGKVVAVGPGTAHVVISTIGGMWDVHRYNVTGASAQVNTANLPNTGSVDFAYEIQNFSSNSMNTFSLKVGQNDSPTAALWLSTGSGSAYTSDENVVTVASNGTVTAVAPGTAYVLICASIGNMHEIYKYVVTA